MWRVSAGVRLSLAFPPSSSFVPAVLGSKRTAKSKQSGACFGNQHRSCPRRCGAVVGQRQRADCDSVLLHARVQVVKTERIEWKGPFVCVAVLKTEKAIVPYVHTYLLPRESHTACAHTWQLVRTPGSYPLLTCLAWRLPLFARRMCRTFVSLRWKSLLGRRSSPPEAACCRLAVSMCPDTPLVFQ